MNCSVNPSLLFFSVTSKFSLTWANMLSLHQWDVQMYYVPDVPDVLVLAVITVPGQKQPFFFWSIKPEKIIDNILSLIQ